MKASFALITVLAGLALATPSNPAARAEAAAAAAAAEFAEVGAPNAEQEAEVTANVEALAALDPSCVSCVRRNCSASWVCLRATAAPLVIACLLARRKSANVGRLSILEICYHLNINPVPVLNSPLSSVVDVRYSGTMNLINQYKSDTNTVFDFLRTVGGLGENTKVLDHVRTAEQHPDISRKETNTVQGKSVLFLVVMFDSYVNTEIYTSLSSGVEAARLANPVLPHPSTPSHTHTRTYIIHATI
ncbi:uncharacterized protein B0I36DRAFT_355530 [Microdochium trichocladiopsis]|uniref:Uncharacterized protein n=1 Tax=Microdochium trichocladiopsis TaxID=1682393 RepID=A0A9P8XRX3_9PEZI|nr:uncharacterized protein B0I36DRAFT_355530 [Microdochium trichocladiopsis]KAH7014288.1 hypothetical protein B0I36DRAFT_355530 [Microdochium trichocladiopsis]